MNRTDINKIQEGTAQFFWYRQSFSWITISSLRDHPSKKRKTIWNTSQGASKDADMIQEEILKEWVRLLRGRK